jgi:hypothetical protein
VPLRLIKQQKNSLLGDRSRPAKVAIRRVAPRARVIASELSSLKLSKQILINSAFRPSPYVRERKPETYMRVVADLLPKEANINVEAGEAFVNLWRRISEGFGDELVDRLDDPSVVLN